MGWYVVETDPQEEESAEKEINELGLRTLLLKQSRARRSHHRFARPFTLVFPGYVFAEFDLSQDEFAWPAIPGLYGVKTILGMHNNGDVPLALRPKDFERLQELATELASQVPEGSRPPKHLDRETVVQILWGPWQGLVGKIEFDNGSRVDLLIASAGSLSKVNLPRELVEAL